VLIDTTVFVGIVPKSISIAESELAALSKGDNEIIEELDENGVVCLCVLDFCFVG
jgi:hypothetical protein